jgi:hypothetical protein
MNWVRYIRGLILGSVMIGVSLNEGGFGSVREALVTLLFVVLGAALVVFMLVSAVINFKAAKLKERIESTPVVESPDAGMGFLRREREERERERAAREPA